MSGGGGSKGGTTGDNSEKRWGDTTSKKGETSRVFVGNIDSYKTTCSDLSEYCSASRKERLSISLTRANNTNPSHREQVFNLRTADWD